MLTQLKNCVKNEKNNKAIFDIVLFGSTAKGKQKPGDIDLAVIFNYGPFAERLDYVQEIKNNIRKKCGDDINLDIKPYLLKDLFDYSFFGRVGLFLEGISLLEEKPFSRKIGFKAYSLFTYTLTEKKQREKVKFTHLLSGRKGMKGILKDLNGERLASGAVKIPIEKSIEFEDILKMHKINYKKKNVLEEL